MSARRVLFACTHNSARSQMAEAFLRELGGDRFEVFSAGVQSTGIRPETHTVMEEVGLSLARHRSKPMGEFAGQRFDYFITVCADAGEACPFLPGEHISAHWDVADPARAEGTDEERLDAFRRARDELREKVLEFVSRTPPG